ncbi:MAG: cell wall-active antibiotics response protein [Alicyclobacillus sp.]|nr:cell wall-active antibiotics response protein [Alicyclobacillus sp.]
MRGRWMLGAVLVGVGAVILMSALGVVHIHPWQMLSTYFWPLVFGVAGIAFLADMRVWSFSRVVTGLGLLAVGLLMGLSRAGIWRLPVHSAWDVIWPVALIVVGVEMLASGGKGGRSWAIMSGISRRHPGWVLRSSDYWALMGGIHLDLRRAERPDEDVTLVLTTLMGGIDIIVPARTHVVCRGTCVLGGMTLFGQQYGGVVTSHSAESGDPETRPTIYIHGTALLGGIRVMERPERPGVDDL